MVRQETALPWPLVTFKVALAGVAAEAGSLRQWAGEGWAPPGEKAVLQEAVPRPTGLRAQGGGQQASGHAAPAHRAPPRPALHPDGGKQLREAARGSGLCGQHCGT